MARRLLRRNFHKDIARVVAVRAVSGGRRTSLVEEIAIRGAESVIVGRVDVAVFVVGVRVVGHFVDGAMARPGGSGGP